MIDALSRGYSKYSDILSQSHVSSSPALANVLDKLTQMEIIKNTSPINDEIIRKNGYIIQVTYQHFIIVIYFDILHNYNY